MPSDPNFHDDDNLDTSGGFPDAETGTGNRPAHGARHASPGEVLSSAFHGSANAGDFLGLDLEVNEPAADDGFDLASAESRYAPGTEPAVHEEAPHAHHEHEEGEYDEEPYEGEDAGYGEVDPELAAAFDEAPRKSRAGLMAAVAFVVGLVVVAGAVMGPEKLLNKLTGKGGDSQVARTPGGGTGGAVTRTPSPASTATPDDGAATETGTGTELVELVDDPVENAASDPVETPDPAATATADPTSDGGDDFASATDILSRLGGDEVSELPQLGEGMDGQPFDPAVFQSEAWMSGELVDMVWRDTSIPMEAISHPARIMTPRVGRVRVHLDTGEVLEGRLYALGQDTVWIEGEMGRLGLDGDRVERFERIPEEVAQANGFDPTQVGAGKRVRVQVPGGAIYGRVLSVVDDRVTLVTDDGGRVSLYAPDIEQLGPSRAILVER